MKTLVTLTTDQRFFYDNAGWSYNPETETEEEGRINCAVALDAAESQGLAAGLYVRWSIDEGASSADFREDTEDGSTYKDPWPLWTAAVYGPEESEEVARPSVLESLGGVDFGRDGSPYGDDYARVIRAELFSQVLA
jgi:hypothetical protein